MTRTKLRLVDCDFITPDELEHAIELIAPVLGELRPRKILDLDALLFGFLGAWGRPLSMHFTPMSLGAPAELEEICGRYDLLLAAPRSSEAPRIVSRARRIAQTTALLLPLGFDAPDADVYALPNQRGWFVWGPDRGQRFFLLGVDRLEVPR